MTDDPNLWDVRILAAGLTLELWGGANLALVLAEGERQARGGDLPRVKVVAML
jgi:hypothetical protein